MDPSLVRLSRSDGRLLGQWRLDDPRLSLRHLASRGGTVAVALQAEHDATEARAAAPVLALLDGDALRTVANPQGLSFAGYAGDVAAHGSGFALSASRAGMLVRWSAATGWDVPLALLDTCALATIDGRLMVAGRESALAIGAGPAAPLRWPDAPLRADNHWVAVGR